MRLYKILFLLIFFIIFIYKGQAQAVMSFDQVNFDFGKVAEGTQATHEFTFKNTGNTPLIIDKVQASCGCTTPYWTKEPVMPGKKGVISASYNSSNRPGAFNKSITITSNATPAVSKLTIKGTVVPVNQVDVVYSKEELENSPTLSIEKTLTNLGKVEFGKTVPFNTKITNTGKSNLVISGLRSDCNCVEMTPGSTSVVLPGETRSIEFTYKATQKGRTKVNVSILSNDLNKPENTFPLVAEVVESLTNVSILKESNPGFTF